MKNNCIPPKKDRPIGCLLLQRLLPAYMEIRQISAVIGMPPQQQLSKDLSTHHWAFYHDLAFCCADIGFRASIIGNVTIGDSTVIAAGAIVVNLFPEDNVVIGGCPANVIKRKPTQVS